MSDIFESDIDDEKQALESLEDAENDAAVENNLTFDKPLYHLKLAYSRESLFAFATMELKPSDKVMVPTRYGRDLAIVLGETKKPFGISESDIITIERVATHEDLKKEAHFQSMEADASRLFKEKAAYHKLDIKLVQMHFLIGEPKALFFFRSENRVDFRELVKDLVAVLKQRIELRQIGVRDESRITGGLGVCGRPYCCHAVSDKLKPVSIRMAKDQNLSLNSTKISGQCGRLLCCLSYEHDWYAEERNNLPNEGLHLFYDGSNFKITEINPITQMIKMLGDDGRLIEVNAHRFSKNKENRWTIQ